MARYEYEFSGIPARFVPPEGLDPNYRGGYSGMRMRGGRGIAPYGAHRLTHAQDVDGWGGFGGIHQTPMLPGGIDWDWGGGHAERYDHRRPRLIREFNANSPGLRASDPDELERREQRAPERQWAQPRQYRPGYSNRGITDAGFSENWAHFPMRGGR